MEGGIPRPVEEGVDSEEGGIRRHATTTGGVGRRLGTAATWAEVEAIEVE